VSREFGKQLSDIVRPPPGPESRRLADELARYESRNVTFLSDQFPVFWQEAHGSNVRDADGNVYVDLTAAFGVAAAGHGHPSIVAAVTAQAARLLHGMGDVHPPVVKAELLKRLSEVAPGNLNRSILANSGAEAVEAALKTMMLATGKPRVLAFNGSYHGLTMGTLAVSGRSDFRSPFAAQLGPGAVLVDYPNRYQSDSLDEEVCARANLDEVERALDRASRTRIEVGGIIAEPVQGRGGDIVPPRGWLSGIREICNRRGILLILDEIYTGFGRTGRWFACEHEAVLPDLLVVGKALTGGLPFAACIGSDEVMSAWPKSSGEALHTSTFLGHPLGCAAALASIEVIRSERLAERSASEGAYALARLRGSLGDHPRVGDVRGLGLMIGVEFVLDRAGRVPAPELVGRIVVEGLRRGVILLGGGVHSNVLSLSPPLAIDRDQLDFGLSVVEEIVGTLE